MMLTTAYYAWCDGENVLKLKSTKQATSYLSPAPLSAALKMKLRHNEHHYLIVLWSQSDDLMSQITYG
jgi:hypothetical protein